MLRYRPQNLFDSIDEFENYDEWPSLHPTMDPQAHVSRNSIPQPFFLVCEHDCVLVTLTGTGKVELKRSSVNEFLLRPGDHVYVPGWTPHRIVPDAGATLFQVRFKALHAGQEAVAWYCDSCGNEIHRSTFDAETDIPQAAWQRSVDEFNADEQLRTCTCGHVHPLADATGTRWPEMAKAVEEMRATAPPDDPMYGTDDDD